MPWVGEMMSSDPYQNRKSIKPHKYHSGINSRRYATNGAEAFPVLSAANDY
jgi:hypothetical protein